MTDGPDQSGPDDYDQGSRVEAAEAGLHAEIDEVDGATRGHHVTAVDVAGAHPHRHHPEDPNIGVVRMRLGRGTMLAGVLASLVTLAALIALAVAAGNH